MTKTIRSEQVGSLLRPEKLLKAREAFKAGQIDHAALAKVEDESISECIKMQQEVGIDVISDGEMRRDAWQTNFSQAVDGFEPSYSSREMVAPDGTRIAVQMHTKAIVDKLKPHGRLAQRDAAFLKQRVSGPFKITMPSPAVIARTSFRAGVTDRAYADVEALLADTTAIVKSEMLSLAEEGVPYIQLDEGFTIYAAANQRDQLISSGVNLEEAVAQDIAAENACYDAVRRPGVILAMHLCRGSRKSHQRGTGDYDWISERVFDQLHVDRFVLEYDSDRVGGFEPLRRLPKGKIAVLGLLASTSPTLESKDTLLRRIEAAAKFCSVDQLAISAQCGFQGAAQRDGAHMSQDEQRRKLERIVEVAHAVWGS